MRVEDSISLRLTKENIETLRGGKAISITASFQNKESMLIRVAPELPELEPLEEQARKVREGK